MSEHDLDLAGLKATLEGAEKTLKELRENHEENEKKRDVLLEEKMAKINDALDQSHENVEKFSVKEKQLEEKETRLSELIEKQEQIIASFNRPGGDAIAGERVTEKDAKFAIAYKDFLRKGLEEMDPVNKANFLEMQKKTLQVGDNTQGGFLVYPQLLNEIITQIEELSPVRSVARVIQGSSNELVIPVKIQNTEVYWVSETQLRPTPTNFTTEQRRIAIHEQHASTDVTLQLLEDASFSVENLIAQEHSEIFAQAEGTAFVLGEGPGQPEGFLTDAAGVPTLATGTAAQVDGDDIVKLTYEPKTPYRERSIFGMNRKTMAAIRILKSNEQYVLQMNMTLRENPGESIQGYRVVEMPDMPDIGTGAKPIIFGDFARAYYIVDRIGLTIQRDPYIAASVGQVRFRARRRVGGLTVLPEALVALDVA